MKTIILISILIVLCLSQNQRPNFDRPKFQSDRSAPNMRPTQNSNQPIPQQTQQILKGILGSLENQPKAQPQYPIDENNRKKHTRDNQFKQGYPRNQMSEISQEQLMVMIVVYGFISACMCGICSISLCLCIKKRNQRQQIKTRMQGLQVNFAQSQNMNLFQMQGQPHFPRTIHI